MSNPIHEIKMRIERPAALLKAVGKMMQADVAKNIETEGANLGIKWQPLSKNYVKRKSKEGKSSKMLIYDGPLLQSILGSSPIIAVASGRVAITTNKEYSRIHHDGGVIHRAAYSGTVRLRSDRKGNLIRQDDFANLSKFAKASHKRVRNVRFTVEAFDIRIPARSYMQLSDKGFDEIKRAVAVWITDARLK